MVPDSVVHDQPSLVGWDWWGGESDFVCVPPCASVGWEHDDVASPVFEVGREREPHVGSHFVGGAMHEGEFSVEAAREDGGVFVVGVHDEAMSFEGFEVLG